MTMSGLRYVASVFVLVTLGLTASVSAEVCIRHSGTIVSIAEDARTFVVAEVGPWQIRDGATVITYRTITLAAETEFAIVARADTAPSGFPGDFVETPVGPDRVYLGDYVTVDCRHEGKRLVALKITVPAPPAGNSGRGIPR
jgi:hypothetical protein